MLPETRLPLNSLFPNADRVAELKALFPEAFLENRLDFNRLKQALGEAVHTDRERYGLNWAGKTNAIHALQSLSVGTLKPDRNASVNFDTTENMIIEGDNLEVLKLLQKSYFGKVKMIYIDPPYNTGNEFIYPDNFREGLEDYLKYSGQLSADGTATTSNKETDGRYHSKWLSMMYPRLFLAKNLLRDDGVIFISIDDHEVYNLRLAMNEIFGEENFICQIIWKSRVSEDTRAKMGMSVDHEYILCYGRSEASTLRGSNKDLDKFSNPDDDSRGPWRSADLTGLATKDKRPNLHYDLINHETGINYGCPPKGWRYDPNTMGKKILEKRILFPVNSEGRPRHKLFLNEMKSLYKNVSSVITSTNTAEGTREVNNLLGDGIFSFPKPTNLVKLLAEQATSDDDIILDFFAGSGTTAQAVLELNKEDSGDRYFILVQLPEKTHHKQFSTISIITRERVRRVIQKMNEFDVGKLPMGESTPDRGFKAFQLAASNFKIWEDTETEADAEAVATQLELFADNLLPDAASEDILFEILIKAGYDLNVSREQITIAGLSVYSIAEGRQLICLERDITREALAGMIARKPEGVICLDEAFHGDDALLTNTLLQMQDVGIRFQTI